MVNERRGRRRTPGLEGLEGRNLLSTMMPSPVEAPGVEVGEVSEQGPRAITQLNPQPLPPRWQR